MPVVIVVGTQWGDEGKGKIIDVLSKQATHIVRAQGGNNAGHTVLVGNEEYKLHLIPSGILYPKTTCYIGGGTVLDPDVLLQEIAHLRKRGIQLDKRLKISKAAHVIFPYHRLWDHLAEKKRPIGTTGKGIGPAYSDKINRIGIRIAELIEPELLKESLRKVISLKNEELIFLQQPLLNEEEIFNLYVSYGLQLLPFIDHVEEEINLAIENKKNVLLEGAQGTFLDITFGTYPFVTSSQTIAAGICAGAGVGPSKINHTLGIVKAYTTRVGNGPFPTELKENELFVDHFKSREIGTTTGRKRRIGWFDAMLVKQAVRLNGIDSIAMTKLDILDDVKEIKICVGYLLKGQEIDYFPSAESEFQHLQPIYETLSGWNESTKGIVDMKLLPEMARSYLKRIEELCGVPISMISVGPGRENTCMIRDLFV